MWRRGLLEILVIQVLGELLSEPELQLVQTQLQEVVHQGNLSHKQAPHGSTSQYASPEYRFENVS